MNRSQGAEQLVKNDQGFSKGPQIVIGLCNNARCGWNTGIMTDIKFVRLGIFTEWDRTANIYISLCHSCAAKIDGLTFRIEWARDANGNKRHNGGSVSVSGAAMAFQLQLSQDTIKKIEQAAM